MKVDGAKCEALNEKDAVAHCSIMANEVPSMDRNIQLGKMPIDIFWWCDELHENISGQVGTIKSSLLDGDDPINGDDNVATEFDLEGMNLAHAWWWLWRYNIVLYV